jgi:hypothetical protein
LRSRSAYAQSAEQAVTERAADRAKTSADGTLQQAIATLGLVSRIPPPVEYDHAYEGDVLTIVHTDSEHIA